MSGALVVLSGGQDSTTVAAIACAEHYPVHAITFDYGQRHSIEIESARWVAEKLALDSHEIIDVKGVLKSTSPLTSVAEVEQYNSAVELPLGVADTFIPCRNQLFLTIAANRAIALGVNVIYTGVCETDYSGYPDCRQTFINCLELATNTGHTGASTGLMLCAPLMHLTKAESVKLALDLLGDRFEEIMELTHTCYNGVKGGCGRCAACLLRDRGFKEAQMVDPLWKFRVSAA